MTNKTTQLAYTVKGEKEGKLTKADTPTPATPPEGALGGKNGAPAIDKEKEEQQRTQVKKKLFLEIYRKTLGSVKATCEKVGIVRETFYDWMKNDPDFNMAIRMSWQQKLEDVEELANKEMLAGNSSLIRHFLDRRHPLYKPKVKVEGPLPGEMSAEDDVDEFFAVNDEIENYEPEKTTDESGVHPSEIPNQKQEGDTGTIPAEQSTGVLLDTQNPKEPDTQSPTKGTE